MPFKSQPHFEEWSREFPRFIKPMTATLVQTVPEGPDWMYEVKLDGYRALILKSSSHVQIRLRNSSPRNWGRRSRGRG